jgi:hypothetical protein
MQSTLAALSSIETFKPGTPDHAEKESTMPAIRTDHSATTSATRAGAVTPDDNTDLASETRGIYVGVAGNLSVVMIGGDTVTIPVQAGLHPLAVSRIRSTGTTATGLVAVW